MTTQLLLYNEALTYCGERMILNLADNAEPRRLLDQVWANGGVQGCLEQGQWHFAMKAVMLDYDPSVTPDFGYRRAFNKPNDWVLTSALCTDEYFRMPDVRYWDEAGYWYTDVDTIYVRYVSSDAAYGGNLGAWPESFMQFVACHFAAKIILKISNDESKKDQLLKLREKLKKEAKGRAAMAEPTMFAAQGSWSRARMRFGRAKDGGNTGGSLIG